MREGRGVITDYGIYAIGMGVYSSIIKIMQLEEGCWPHKDVNSPKLGFIPQKLDNEFAWNCTSRARAWTCAHWLSLLTSDLDIYSTLLVRQWENSIHFRSWLTTGKTLHLPFTKNYKNKLLYLAGGLSNTTTLVFVESVPPTPGGLDAIVEG